MEVPNVPEVGLDPLDIWIKHEEASLEWLREHPERTTEITPVGSPECIGAAVLIETRKHPSAEAVLRTFVHFLAPQKWGLVIFHSRDNGAFFRDIVRGWDAVTLIQLDLPEKISMPEYNKLMTSEDLWTKMPHENVLLFQTDCTLLTGTHLAHGSKFLKYDYVGAPWFAVCPRTARVYSPTMVPSYTVVDEDVVCQLSPNHVGNGGLSLRKKSAMLECISRFPWIERPMTVPIGPFLQPKDGKMHIATMNEDTYFAMALHLLKKPSCPRDLASKFSCEIVPPYTLVSDSAPVVGGLHKVYAYLPADIVRTLLSQSKLRTE